MAKESTVQNIWSYRNYTVLELKNLIGMLNIQILVANIRRTRTKHFDPRFDMNYIKDES